MKLFTSQNIVGHMPTIFPSPGAENAALQVRTSHPSYDAGGAGRLIFRQLFLFAPNVTTTNMYPAYGYGGLMTGQFVGQSLMVPQS